MIALALPLLFTQAPKADAKFTYRTRGTTVAAILAAVSRQTGVPLEATPATAKEIVLVDVRDAKLSDFMPRLAKVATGEWRAEGRGFRLIRSDDFARRSRLAEDQATAQRLAAEFEARTKRLIPFGTAEAEALAARVMTTYQGRQAANDGNYFRTMSGLNAESPTGRFAVRALAALGGPALASLRPQERRVYAVRPNRMQTALPFDPKPLLDLYRKEQAPFAKALEKRLDPAELRNNFSGALQVSDGEPPARLLFVVARQEYQDGVKIRVVFIDREDRITQDAMASIDVGGDPFAPPKKVEPGDKPVDLAPTSRAYVTAIRAIMGGKPAPVEGDLLKELENPERHDPISFVTPDGLRAAAGGRNVVAQVEDSTFITMPMLTTEDGTLGLKRFHTGLETGHQIDEEDGWLVVTPKRPWNARETRIDRAHLGRFFRAARAQGGTNLSQLAEYALGAPRRYVETVSFAYAFLLHPQVNASISMDNLEFLRIYGALDARQRRQLEESTPMTVGELPPAARAELAHLAFRDGAPLQYTIHGEDRREGRPLEHEPTEAMPSGLPATATLLGRLTAEEAVIGRVEASGGGSQAYRPMRAWDLAWNLAFNESGAHPNDATRHSKYRMGRIGKLDMAVKFTDMLGVERDLMQTEFLDSTPWVSFEALPAPFRDAVTKHLPEAREKVAEMRKRDAANKVPPP